MQPALLLLLLDVAHTLFPPEGPVSAGVCVCRFASYSLRFIQLLGDLGVGVKLASGLFFFVNGSSAEHPTGLSLRCL